MRKKTYENDGLVGNVLEDSRDSVMNVFRARRRNGFFTGQVIVILNPISGLRVAGPVTVLTHDKFGGRLVVSSKVTVEAGDAIYISGSQTESQPPVVSER